jgi:hypothetical protein
MFEALVIGAGILFGLAMLAFVAKLVLGLILLPVHLGFFIIKGLLVLLIVVPIVLVSLAAAACVLPVIFAIFGLPILILAAGVILLVKLIR